MDADTEPPMEGPGGEPQLYCKPIGVDADDASDGDGADASDAGDSRLILGSHRALDAIGGFVPPTDLQALRVVSKTASDSRVLVATIRVVTQRWTACAASKRARRRLEAVDREREDPGHGGMEPLRPRPRQLAGHQGLRRGQLVGPRG